MRRCPADPGSHGALPRSGWRRWSKQRPLEHGPTRVYSGLVRPIWNRTLCPISATSAWTSPGAVGLSVGPPQDRQVDAASPAVSGVPALRSPGHAPAAGVHPRPVGAGRPLAGPRWIRPHRPRHHRRSAEGAGPSRRGPPAHRERGPGLRAVRLQRPQAEAGALEPARGTRLALRAPPPGLAGSHGIRSAAGPQPRPGSAALRQPPVPPGPLRLRGRLSEGGGSSTKGWPATPLPSPGSSTPSPSATESS